MKFGAIAWPNGADLAPDALCEQLFGSTHASSRRPAPTSGYPAPDGAAFNSRVA